MKKEFDHWTNARLDVHESLPIVGVDVRDKHVVKTMAIAQHAEWLAAHPEHFHHPVERAEHAKASINEALTVRFTHLSIVFDLLASAKTLGPIETSETAQLKKQLLKDDLILHLIAEFEHRGIAPAVTMLWAETQCIAKAARKLVEDRASHGEHLTIDQARYRLEVAIGEMRADRTLRRAAALLYGI